MAREQEMPPTAPPPLPSTRPVAGVPRPATMRLPPAIWKLAFFTGVMFQSNALLTPLLDRLVREPFHLTNAETSRFMAVNGAAQLLCGIPAGILSDRLGRRLPLMGVGLILAGLAFAAIPHVGSYPALLWLRFAEGVFGAAAGTLIFARVLDVAPEGLRGRAFAVVTAALPVGYLTGPALAGWLGDERPALLLGVNGVLMALCGLWALAMAPGEERLRHHEPTPGEIARVVRTSPRLAIPMLFSFVDNFTFGSIAVLTATVLRDVHGVVEVGTVAKVIAAFWVAFLAGCVPMGRLMERFGAWRLMLGGSFAYGVAFMALGRVGLGMFGPMMAVCGLLTAVMYIPSRALIGELAGREHRGVASAGYQAAGLAGVVLGLVIAGHLSDVSYRLAYAVAGIMEVACAAACALAMPGMARGRAAVAAG